MEVAKTSWTVRIMALVVIVALIYIAYKWYNYSQCKKNADGPCDKSKFSAVANSVLKNKLSAGTNGFLPLSDAELANMNELATKANNGAALTPAEWTTLNALIFRNVKNGGTDPVIRNKGKVKCSFWGAKTCE